MMTTTGLRNRVLAFALLVGAAMFVLPAQPAVAGYCGCPPMNSMWSCFDCASEEHFRCYTACGYSGNECTDACDTEWFENQGNCGNCPV